MQNPFLRNYKLFVVIPLFFSLILVFLAFVFPGLKPGLDIQGGTMVVVQTGKPLDLAMLENALNERFDLAELKVTGTSFGVRIQFAQSERLATAKATLLEAESLLASNPFEAKQRAFLVLQGLGELVEIPPEFDSLEPRVGVETARKLFSIARERFNARIQETVLQTLNLSPAEAAFQVREVGSALGKAFWENAVNVSIVAVVLISIVIFGFFREFIPSLAIVLAAIIDILAALGGMALFEIPLSLATIPALLMLVGYSIDTDILLTTRVLKKREGEPAARAFDSMKTGLTMTFTTLGAVGVMLALSFFGQITIIFEIAAVLCFGLIGDGVSTWLLNAPILLWYAERKKRY